MSAREERQRRRALEEQRKAGTAPAEVDAETGHDINPHIPQWMAQAPWYLSRGHATLAHQRRSQVAEPLAGRSAGARTLPSASDLPIVSGVLETDALFAQRAVEAAANDTNATTKDADTTIICANCGVKGHEAQHCMERPRRNKAIAQRSLRAGFDSLHRTSKPSGLVFKSSSTTAANKNLNKRKTLDAVELSFEAKRDRWNGFDASKHTELADLQRQQNLSLKRTSSAAAAATGSNTPSSSGSTVEGTGKESATQTGETKKTPVSNLRIREDTAKYLRNLDLDSAHYDPKTRSMREAPLKEVVGKIAKGQMGADYIGDNFLRFTGDTQKVLDMQTFAWEASDRHGNQAGVHMEANPTVSEKLYKEYQERKQTVTRQIKASVLEKYGGEKFVKPMPKELKE